MDTETLGSLMATPSGFELHRGGGLREEVRSVEDRRRRSSVASCRRDTVRSTSAV